MASGERRAARKEVAVVGAYPDSVVGFRGELIRGMAEAGCAVTVMAAEATEEVQRGIEGLAEVAGGQGEGCGGQEEGVERDPNRREAAGAAGGQVSGVGLPVEEVVETEKGRVRFRPYWVQRNGMSVSSDRRTLNELKSAFQEMKPDLILAYTIKPIIWGGIAARSVPGTRFFAMVTGLGYAFQGGSWKRRLLNQLVVRLYRFALKRAEGVIFQNADNRDLFIQHRIVPPNKCHVVSGSGINVHQFKQTALPSGDPHFLLIARLLGEKGIREYAAAARQVKKVYPEARFSLVGPEDPSPDGIPIAEVRQWVEEGIIQYDGSTDDVRPYLQDCHIYVLPSYHEGMPRTVLEAMAIGRPILTTNVTGCKETVENDVNGWLVPKADADALAQRMVWFIENRNRWEGMAAASRKLAEERFEVGKVNSEMMRILGI